MTAIIFQPFLKNIWAQRRKNIPRKKREKIKTESGTQNGRPLGVAPTASGQAALRSDFRNENQSHAPLSLLFREKSRLRMLGVDKCTHNAFAALPTFHGIYGERKRLKIIKSRGVYVAFYTSMRVETACRFVSQGK